MKKDPLSDLANQNVRVGQEAILAIGHLITHFDKD
jgi:hypothetical protein